MIPSAHLILDTRYIASPTVSGLLFRRIKKLQAVRLWGAVLYFLELAVEKGDTFKSNLVTNITHLSVCFNQQFTGAVNPVFIQKVKKDFIRLLLKKREKYSSLIFTCAATSESVIFF